MPHAPSGTATRLTEKPMSLSDHIAEALRAEISLAVAEETGADAVTARRVANRIFARLQRYWGGTRLYIPAADNAERNRDIRAAFTGANHAEVCRRFGVSLRTLYRVIG